MPLYGIPPFLVFGAGEISRNRNARIQSQPHMPSISAQEYCLNIPSLCLCPEIETLRVNPTPAHTQRFRFSPTNADITCSESAAMCERSDACVKKTAGFAGLAWASRFLRHVRREASRGFRFPPKGSFGREALPAFQKYERRDPVQRDFASFSGNRERREGWEHPKCDTAYSIVSRKKKLNLNQKSRTLSRLFHR